MSYIINFTLEHQEVNISRQRIDIFDESLIFTMKGGKYISIMCISVEEIEQSSLFVESFIEPIEFIETQLLK